MGSQGLGTVPSTLEVVSVHDREPSQKSQYSVMKKARGKEGPPEGYLFHSKGKKRGKEG